MAQKVKPVKWALGGGEPEDLQEFLSNDDIIAKHGLPPKGLYTWAVKRITKKDNKNGDPRLSVMLVMAEPKKSENAKYNGFLVWDGFNVVDGPSLGFLKRFLKGLGLSWDDFLTKTKENDEDPPHLVQIGKVKFEGAKDPVIKGSVKVKPADDYNDDEYLQITRYVPLDDGTESESSDDGAADDGGEAWGAAEEAPKAKKEKKGKAKAEPEPEPTGKKGKGKKKKGSDEPPF